MMSSGFEDDEEEVATTSLSKSILKCSCSFLLVCDSGLLYLSLLRMRSSRLASLLKLELCDRRAYVDDDLLVGLN